MRRRESLASGLLLALCASLTSAGAAAQVTPAPAASERRKVDAVKERKVESRERVTLETRAADEARSRRKAELALRIPAALRQRVLARVEARITANLERARSLRREALALLRQLERELPAQAPERPETLMRLGELEWEEARESFLTRFARWERTPSDQRAEPPAPDYARPRARFKLVLDGYPGFSRYDLALYVDGFLALEEGRTEQALQRFGRILAEHPGSPFVPDAHMVRAEAELAGAAPNYQYALDEYEAVLSHPKAELHDLALYKSAWALWRLGQTAEAARRFLLVFKTGAEAKGAPRAGARGEELDQLQAEALKNLVAVFVEDEKNTAEDMHRFLVEAGGERFAGEIVRALAEALYEQAHYARGIEAYRLLLRLDPTADDAYEHALAIALAHSTLETWGELRQDYAWLLDEYVPRVRTATPAARAPGAPAASPPSANAAADPKRPGTQGAWIASQERTTLARAAAAIERRLFDDAIGLHAKAQADRTSRIEFESAAALYGVYLSRFYGSPRAYEAYFNLGEVQFHHLGDAVAAADAYLAAVRLRPDGPWSRDALYNALAALSSARQAELEAARTAGREPTDSATDKKLTEAMELYGATYPDDPELPELLFRQGRLYYDYEVYDAAVRQWGLLLERHDKSSQARAAGELILDSFNKSRDYQNIEIWGRRLLEAPAFAEPKAQAKLSELIVQAIFKQGEQASEAGRHRESAAAYLRAAREFPRDDRAARAAVNAAIEAERAVDLVALREAASLLVEAHVASSEAPSGVWIAARVHQSLGLLAEAADYYEALDRNWPKDERHEDAAYDAVLLRTTLGQRQQAIALGERFKRRYPSGPSSDEVSFLMGKAHEQARAWSAAETLYARYASSAKLPSRRIEALVRLAAARVELKDERGAQSALERAIKQHKAHARSLDERGRYFSAQARFARAQRVLAEFEQITIEGDVKQLGQRLRRKAELLKRASNALLDTAKLGVAEWTTAALYQIGFVYESFAKALMSSPPPSNLTAEQAEQYSMQIDEFVVPIEERSIEAYESGWQKALELGIFNAWTAKMRQALGRLNAELYPPLLEIGFRLRAESGSQLPELISSVRRTEAGTSREFLLTQSGAPAASASRAQTPAGAPAPEAQ